jgi:hypothetical protein
METPTSGGNMSDSSLIEVGRFTFDTSTQVLTGPRDYLESVGGADAAVAKALRCPSFKLGLEYQPNPAILLLVALQTDYAAFAGSRDFAARLGSQS